MPRITKPKPQKAVAHTDQGTMPSCWWSVRTQMIQSAAFTTTYTTTLD